MIRRLKIYFNNIFFNWYTTIFIWLAVLIKWYNTTKSSDTNIYSSAFSSSSSTKNWVKYFSHLNTENPTFSSGSHYYSLFHDIPSHPTEMREYADENGVISIDQMLDFDLKKIERRYELALAYQKNKDPANSNFSLEEDFSLHFSQLSKNPKVKEYVEKRENLPPIIEPFETLNHAEIAEQMQKKWADSNVEECPENSLFCRSKEEEKLFKRILDGEFLEVLEKHWEEVKVQKEKDDWNGILADGKCPKELPEKFTSNGLNPDFLKKDSENHNLPQKFLLFIGRWGPNNQIYGFYEALHLVNYFNQNANNQYHLNLVLSPFFKHKDDLEPDPKKRFIDSQARNHKISVPPEIRLNVGAIPNVVSLEDYKKYSLGVVFDSTKCVI